MQMRANSSSSLDEFAGCSLSHSKIVFNETRCRLVKIVSLFIIQANAVVITFNVKAVFVTVCGFNGRFIAAFNI